MYHECKFLPVIFWWLFFKYFLPVIFQIFFDSYFFRYYCVLLFLTNLVASFLCALILENSLSFRSFVHECWCRMNEEFGHLSFHTQASLKIYPMLFQLYFSSNLQSKDVFDFFFDSSLTSIDVSWSIVVHRSSGWFGQSSILVLFQV